MTQDPVTEDRWLGTVLQRPVFRVALEPTATEGAIRSKTSAAGFYYCSIPATGAALVAEYIRAGFVLVETAVNLEKPKGQAPQNGDARIREAAASDEERVVRLAAASFEYSRFHRDSAFTTEEANRVKAEWTRNFFRGGRGDHLVVAEERGDIAGFMLLLRRNRTLILDLIAVSAAHRKSGVARAMIAFADGRYDGFDTWLVGTQLSNIPSIRLYERSGFLFSGASFNLHCHR